MKAFLNASIDSRTQQKTDNFNHFNCFSRGSDGNFIRNDGGFGSSGRASYGSGLSGFTHRDWRRVEDSLRVGSHRWRWHSQFSDSFGIRRRSVSETSSGGDIGKDFSVNDLTEINDNDINELLQADRPFEDPNNLPGSGSGQLTPQEAIVQACASFVFMPKDDAQTAPRLSLTDLRTSISRRTRRAKQRQFALDALGKVLKLQSVANDPSSIEDIFIFVRSAFISDSIVPLVSEDATEEKKTAKMKANKRMNHVHYLCNLEGCNAEVLGQVQMSFVDLYTTLSSLLTGFLRGWHSSRAGGGDCSFDSQKSPADPELFPLDASPPPSPHLPSSHPFTAHPPQIPSEIPPTQFSEISSLTRRSSHIYVIPVKMILSLWCLDFSRLVAQY